MPADAPPAVPARDRWRTTVLWAALALIAAATLTPNPGAQVMASSHWCWRCGSVWLADAVSNVVLFVPLGVALAWRGWPPWRVLLGAFALTALVETLQWQGVPPGRLASRLDLLGNTLGALVGVALWRLAAWRHPGSPGAARALAYGWTAAVVGQGLAVGVALAPGGTAVFDSLPVLSEVRQVPGVGWFEGIIDSVNVDGLLGHRGFPGPVILATRPSPAAARVTLHVHGRHPREGEVPLLLLHDAGIWRPWLMVAQNGDAARVTITRRGGDWGLVMPVLRLPGAFAPDSSPRALVLDVVSTPPAVVARGVAEGPRSRWDAYGERRLTPLLGWALVQTQVRTDSRWAWLLHGVWLALLALPVGWWGAQGVTGWRQGAALAAVLGVAVAGGLCLPAAFLGTALPPVGDLGWLAAWGAVGMLAARRK